MALCTQCPWIIGEQCRGTTGVQKQQRARSGEGAPGQPVEQAGEGLTGINRIEQHAFLFGQQADRGQSGGIRFTVARGEILVPQFDLQSRWNLDAEQLGGALQQPLDLGPLCRLWPRYRDPDHPAARPGMRQRQRQAAVGSGAAGREGHGGKILARAMHLLGQLQAGAYIAQRTKRIGATDGHHVGSAPSAAQTLGRRLQQLIGVIQVGDRFDLAAEQVEQQAVAIAQVVVLVRAQRILRKRSFHDVLDLLYVPKGP